jgi:sugar/nucleoside kinase (ribokinase family)
VTTARQDHILCIGQLVADVVARPVDRLPDRGHTDVVEELALVAGGCAANTAAVLAKLGAHSHAVGVVGMDRFGDVVLAELIDYRVDVSGVVRHPSAPTSAVIVVVDRDGERSFLYQEGGNGALSEDMVQDAQLAQAGIVHIGGAMKLPRLGLPLLLRNARQAGCVTSLDTDWDTSGRWFEAVAAALPYLDLIFTNEEEGSKLTGESNPEDAAKRLQEAGAKSVVVKRGERGAAAYWGGRCYAVKAHNVPVQDTTCAGDAFVAGFLFGLSRGWTPEAALHAANAAGALATTAVSHTNIKSLYSLMAFLKSRTEPRAFDALFGNAMAEAKQKGDGHDATRTGARRTQPSATRPASQGG